MFKVLKGSKISRCRLLNVVGSFCLDIEASKTALLLRLNRNTVNRLYGIFRRLIFLHHQSQMKRLAGIVEANETCFGPTRLRGRPGPRKRGRGTHKQPVFGIYDAWGQCLHRDHPRPLPPRFAERNPGKNRSLQLSVDRCVERL